MSDIAVREISSKTTSPTLKESLQCYIIWEKEYPHLVAFLKDKTNWTNVFKLLMIAHDSINNEGVYSIKGAKAARLGLQKSFREWWGLFRSNLALQDPKLKSMGKNLRDFVVAASEEPSHDVKLEFKYREVEKAPPKPTFQPEKIPLRSRIQKRSEMMKFKRLRISSVVKEKNILISKLNQMRSFSSTSSPTNNVRSRSVSSKEASGKTLPHKKSKQRTSTSWDVGISDHSSLQFSNIFRDQDNLEAISVADLYMNIIMKDIAHDLTKREKKNDKKMPRV